MNSPSSSNNEFGDIGQFVSTTITRAERNVSRLFDKSTLSIADPSETPQRSWYNIFGKIGDTFSSIGSGIQSTLTRVIILVVVVAVIALFGMSYVQAKGVQLAKT